MTAPAPPTTSGEINLDALIAALERIRIRREAEQAEREQAA